jgi:cytochrome c-type biogenesis protein CcmH
MMLFYVVASLFIVLALGFALWPLLKSIVFTRVVDSEGVARQAVNVALYKDHLAELEISFAQGNIDQAQLDQLKQELERNLLEDSGTETAAIQKDSDHSVYVLAVLVLLPLLAYALYSVLGNAKGWQLQEQLQAQAVLEQRLTIESNNLALANELDLLNRQIVSGLADYAAYQSHDLDTTLLLARNAMAIADYDKAIAAYQQILELQPDAAQIMAELAQAIFIKADNRAVPVVGMLAERAVAIQPNNPMALGLLGIFYFQQGDYAKTIAPWEKAITLYPADSPNARALSNGLVQARSRLAEQPQAVITEKTEDQNPHQNQTAEAIKVKVAVSLGSAVPVNSGDTVFVYARAWQGPKMPVAIARLSASQLPITLELNDTMAMTPSMTLSNTKQVELVARLSPTGNAIAQQGDWQVSLGPVEPNTASATVYPLVISRPYSP